MPIVIAGQTKAAKGMTGAHARLVWLESETGIDCNAVNLCLYKRIQQRRAGRQESGEVVTADFSADTNHTLESESEAEGSSRGDAVESCRKPGGGQTLLRW